MGVKQNRRFTPEEDARLIALRLANPGSIGAPRKGQPGGLGTIAKALGRRKSSVQVRLQTLAKRDDP